MLINRQMDTEDVVYTHTHTHTHTHTIKYYVTMKKNEILLFMTPWVDLEGIMLINTSQTEEDKYYTISLIQ